GVADCVVAQRITHTGCNAASGTAALSDQVVRRIARAVADLIQRRDDAADSIGDAVAAKQAANAVANTADGAANRADGAAGQRGNRLNGSALANTRDFATYTANALTQVVNRSADAAQRGAKCVAVTEVTQAAGDTRAQIHANVTGRLQHTLNHAIQANCTQARVAITAQQAQTQSAAIKYAGQ